MKKSLFYCIATLLLSCQLQAHTITVTAEFTPSITNPKNNSFTNTTQNYGFCVNFPARCENEGWHSLALGINADPDEVILQNDNVSFNVPAAYRDVVIRKLNSDEHHTLRFAFNGLGARTQGYGGNATGANNQWTGGPGPSWLYPGAGGCSNSGWAVGGTSHIDWFWRWPSRTDSMTCHKTTTVDRGRFPNLRNINFSYILTTPNPLEMSDGVYVGSIELDVAGSGADINIGGLKYKTSDDKLIINFELTVTHEMRINPLDDGVLSLHACQPGKICTESQNKINWERSTITGIAPVLTAESQFMVTSSGSFTTYLSCEFNQGEQCGIRSEKTGHTVPINTFLSLPENIKNKSGHFVKNMPVKNVKDLDYAFFTTENYTINGQGKFHFEITQQDVVAMKKHAPDDYSGIVTVIFDPQVW